MDQSRWLTGVQPCVKADIAALPGWSPLRHAEFAAMLAGVVVTATGQEVQLTSKSHFSLRARRCSRLAGLLAAHAWRWLRRRPIRRQLSLCAGVTSVGWMLGPAAFHANPFIRACNRPEPTPPIFVSAALHWLGPTYPR